ncbi:MAG: hypothetical protein V3W11_08555, partial [bacterium]
LRYQNGTWREEPGHDNHAYSNIDMVSTTDGWVIGRDGPTDKWKVWRWNGSTWSEFQTVTGAIECIDMIDANHGWIGGARYFLRFDGSSWVWGGSAPRTMYGIHMFSDNIGWAVGNRYITRRSGGSWVEDHFNSNWLLGAVRMVNVNQGWASGYTRVGEKGLITKYNGFWREFKVFDNSTTIGSLDIFQGNFGWCVGQKTTSPPYGGFIGFFDGQNWFEIGSPTTNALGGIKIIDRDNAWAVGYYGTILKYKPNVSVIETSLGKIKAKYR